MNKIPEKYKTAFQREDGVTKSVEAYALLGDYYLYEKQNVNQAFLCYEYSYYHSENYEKVTVKEKMDACRLADSFEVHPVSFVILSYNSKSVMQENLRSIRNCCDYGTYEIIVIDNASTDGVREWLMEQKDIKLVFNDKFPGFAAGCNQGVKIADSYNDIFLLNNDAIMTPRALLFLRIGLYEEKAVGAVGPVSSNVLDPQLYDFTRRSHDEWLKLAEAINQPSTHCMQAICMLQGHALLIKRRMWDEIGGLDTNFEFGEQEDLEYGIRAIVLGYKLYICRNSFVFHYGSLYER